MAIVKNLKKVFAIEKYNFATFDKNPYKWLLMYY